MSAWHHLSKFTGGKHWALKNLKLYQVRVKIFILCSKACFQIYLKQGVFNNFILLNAGILPLFLFYLLLNFYLHMHVNIHTAITIRRDPSPFYTYSSSHLDSVAWTN
jgi:hypothetical protein